MYLVIEDDLGLGLITSDDLIVFAGVYRFRRGGLRSEVPSVQWALRRHTRRCLLGFSCILQIYARV